jgi:hypothetical protein
MTNSEHKLRLIFDEEYAKRYNLYKDMVKKNREHAFSYIFSFSRVSIILLYTWYIGCVLYALKAPIWLSPVIASALNVTIVVGATVSENLSRKRRMGIGGSRIW